MPEIANPALNLRVYGVLCKRICDQSLDTLLNLAPFGRWTLSDKAARLRFALR
jgi:hypothetical protein